jgi:hypothetical protein
MRPLALLAVAALGVAGAVSAAPAVTLNGVNIDGVTSQRFESCTVVIDAHGNIHIEAKGYAARAVEAPVRAPAQQDGPGVARPALVGAAYEAAPAAPPGKLSRRYFLATEHSPPGTQYDLAIFINAQWIREVKASETQHVMEITRYLRPGPNKVTLAATKRVVGERVAFGNDVQLRIVVGEGNVGGDHVMIDLPLVETVRTAADVDDRTEEFVFEAR